MISVPRSSEPGVLQRSSAKWLAKLQREASHYQILKNDPHAQGTDIKAAKRRFENAQNKYRHSEVKGALGQMFHGKCAYCESKITVVTYGAIEHFFPKSQYPDLTFEWTNLLLSCDRCNDANHKGTQFPLDTTGNPLLIDPTDEAIDPREASRIYLG